MKIPARSLSLVLASLMTLSAGAKTTYTVKTGDTLYSIAKKYETSPKTLIALNKIENPSNILIGQSLTISDKPDAAKAAQKTSAHRKSHTVGSGDTFYSIAKDHDLSVNELKALNPGVNITHIIVGQKLVTQGQPAKPVVRKKTKKASESQQHSKKSTPKRSKPAPKKKKAEPKVAVKRSQAASKPEGKPSPSPAPKKRASTESQKESENNQVANSKSQKSKSPKDGSEPEMSAKESTPAASVDSVILTKETTFNDFANEHGASTKELNNLNGWNLPSGTVLARGSEIYIPK